MESRISQTFHVVENGLFPQKIECPKYRSMFTHTYEATWATRNIELEFQVLPGAKEIQNSRLFKIRDWRFFFS